MGFESGLIVLWDLKTKAADSRFISTEPLRSISWLSDGKQLVSAHGDGSLVTWNTRIGPRPAPVSVTYPHGTYMNSCLSSCSFCVFFFIPIPRQNWFEMRLSDCFPFLFFCTLSCGISVRSIPSSLFLYANSISKLSTLLAGERSNRKTNLNLCSCLF